MQQHVLSEALQLPEFSRRLVQAANYTVRENLEAAFAVYDGPAVSKIVRQTQDDMENAEGGRDYNTLSRQSFGQIDNYHMEKLTHTEPQDATERPMLRTDFGLIVHTHPVFYDESPKDMQRPSTGDLARFEKRVVHRPDYIDGIAVKHQGLGGIALLLYKASEDFSPQRLQMIEDSPNTPHTLRLMREAGIQSTTLLFDPNKGRLVSDLKSLDLLF